MYLLGNPLLTVKIKNLLVIVPLIQRHNLMHCRQGFTLAKQSNIARDRTGSTFIPPMEPKIFVYVFAPIIYSADRMGKDHPDTDRHNAGKHNNYQCKCQHSESPPQLQTVGSNRADSFQHQSKHDQSHNHFRCKLI